MTDIPVTAPTDVIEQLTAAVEDGTPGRIGLESYAANLGVTPPDDRDGWSIVYHWGPNGEDEGLHWYQPADDPLARVES